MGSEWIVVTWERLWIIILGHTNCYSKTQLPGLNFDVH